MTKRLIAIAASAFALLFVVPLASASAAPSPWWQVVEGSRPTNLWIPAPSEQEIEVTLEGGAAIIGVEVGGSTVGCLGPHSEPSEFFCTAVFGFPASETAAELETMLEGPFGPGVEVSGGPVGVAPFIVKSPGGAPAIVLAPVGIGSATLKSIAPGGSGRLVITATNLGDAPVDGTGTPVTITDELPEGVIATGVEAFAGYDDQFGPVECELEADDLVGCSFEGTLPSYEALEIEVLASLTGDPPAAGAPGKVTISGGGAPPASISQDVKVSPEETPFGIEHFSARSEDEDGVPSAEGGVPSTQGGAHPFQFTTTLQFNAGPLDLRSTRKESRVEQPALPRNVRFELPAGLVGNPSEIARCDPAKFFQIEPKDGCPAESAIGVASVTVVEPKTIGFGRLSVPVFNLPPGHGEPARFGFTVKGAPVVIDTALDPHDKYRIIASVNNASQLVSVLASTVVLWGTPGDPSHDSSRGWGCMPAPLINQGLPCERPSPLAEGAFLRQPVSCQGPLVSDVQIEPWNVPLGTVVEKSSFAADALHGCNQVPFDPSIAAAPTSKLASNPSGFEFQLDMPNAGLSNPSAIAEGQAKKVEVTLPKGMTINPSQAEGLAVCTPADYARESLNSAPGEGCPQASKLGEVQFSTPLLEENGRGSLYAAAPFDNPFGSLIGLYLVARIPERGILVKQAGKVEPDPTTGQLVTTFDDLPQLPFSTFTLRFREGGRAPLVTPPACGTYDVVARFTPWSASDLDNPAPEEIVTRTSSFQVQRGVDGGACPSEGKPPFHPDLVAGTINNSAGSYSPFNVRLTRKDGEQEFTNFSIKLPPGVIGKLAGIDVCSDAAIAAAKARTGPSGGLEELEHPSCPANSYVGRTLVGAGVGGSLTYVPGRIYLAGPFNGAPLSFVSITAARVGPFDLGTVVLRLALKINPETAEVFIDPTGSDPIPHIIRGIPVHARDIRAYTDRPDFVLNPTSCEPTSTASTVLGSGLDFGSAADDEPVTVTSPFQAADCASLGFKPKLSLKLLGGTKRGDNPKLRAVLQSRPGNANIEKIQVTLPHSEFIEQGHFKTICTRVQFAAGAIPGAGCPDNSVYGYARVFTPLLDEPIEGPVFLRSSSHPLPDLVMALHNDQINLNVDGRVDSVKGGRLRSTFELLPDAPVRKAVLSMQGGKKGLFVNSTDLCRRKHNAIVSFVGQNGKTRDFNTPLKPQCGKKSKKSRAR